MSPKKLEKIVYMCIGFFVLALIYFFIGDNRFPTSQEVATSTPVVVSTTPVARMESFTYATSSIQLTVEYAQFVRLSASTTEKMINESLKKEAKALYDMQLKELRQSITPDSLPGQSGREVFFQRKLVKDKIYIRPETGIISIPYENYIDTGGAHGTFFFSSQTLDIGTGKKLALQDILQGAYEDVVFSEIKKQIAVGEDTERCVNCSKELAEQEGVPVFVSENFLLSDTGIVFLYGAYDLGAYAITSTGQEVLVPKEVVESFVARVW